MTHLLCADSAILDGSQCAKSTRQDSIIVTNNHIVKCVGRRFADGTSCGECPSSCLLCRNNTVCDICAAGTSLSLDGACVILENATTQTHTGAVSCDKSFFLMGVSCVPCSSVFGVGCVLCSEHECISCDEDFVLDDGVCRKGGKCESSNGRVCVSCVSGTVRFNATDCVSSSDCAVYDDGVCVQCMKQLVPLTDGTCVESGGCLIYGDGVCLRCSPGMFLSKSGICKSLSHEETYSQIATSCARDAYSTRRSVLTVMDHRGCS